MLAETKWNVTIFRRHAKAIFDEQHHNVRIDEIGILLYSIANLTIERIEIVPASTDAGGMNGE